MPISQSISRFEVDKVSQSTAGIVVPASGVLPVYFDASAGRFLPAQADSNTTAADTIITRIGNNVVVVQEDGLLNCNNHGLTVGKWYVLDPASPGNIITKDTLTGNRLQYICFAVDADSILVRLDPMFIINDDPNDIEFIAGWNTGTDVSGSIAVGDDRLLVVTLGNEYFGATPIINSITIGGQNGTVVITDQIDSGGAGAQSAWAYWTETQIAAFSGTTLSISYTNAPAETQFAHAMFQHVDQTTPVVDSASDTDAAATSNLSATVNVEDGSAAVFAADSGNSTATFTDNSLDGSIFGTAFDGASRSGEVYYWIVPSSGTRTAAVTVTGSNRAVLTTFSLRRAP
jgi:hypothetical protein